MLPSTVMPAGWTPLLPAHDLPPAGPPRRVSVDGLPMAVVAFRDGSGRIGVFLEACPHVGKPKATLTTGCTEEDGLRCKYHGWKYNVAGICVDIPDVPKDVDFGRYPRARPFPAEEHDGMIWILTDL